MHVVVTGGSGFIGSHAVAQLRRRGHDVRVLARRPDHARVVLARLGVGDGIEVVAGDMTDGASVGAALHGADAVLHAAAEAGVSGGTGPTGDVNLVGVREVIGRAVDRSLDPIVYTSTITVHLPTSQAVITADTPLAEPLSAYGRAKRDAEVLVREWQSHGAPITTFVIGGVYGPVSPHLEGSFAALLAALRTFMADTDGGSGVVDVRDLAVLLAAAMEPDRGPRRYVVGGRFLTWAQWIATLSEAVGRDVVSQRVGAADLVELGREFDRQRRHGPVDLPLSEEAAVIMTSGVPTDDSVALEELGGAWRPTVETFRDAVAWLVSEGHLPPELTSR